MLKRDKRELKRENIVKVIKLKGDTNNTIEKSKKRDETNKEGFKDGLAKVAKLKIASSEMVRQQRNNSIGFTTIHHDTGVEDLMNLIYII